MLDVRRMRLLLEVAEQGSMSAAADALNYTPSAISQQIATLEREAGVALVERGPRSVTLTDAGRALVEHTAIILQRLEDAETEIRAIAGLEGGRLRLATFRTAAETVMADAVRLFHKLYPEVELTLTEGEPEEYLPQLVGGGFDLALTFEYDTVRALRFESLEQVQLLEDPMDIMVPADHPAAADEAIDLEQLSDESWVGSTSSSSVHEFTVNVCRSAGFEPRISFETDDYHVAQALVAGGVGVAFLPRLSMRTIHPGIEVRPMAQPAPKRRIFAVFRTGGARSPAVKAMLEVLSRVSAAVDPAPDLEVHDLQSAETVERPAP
ncbi:MAG: transcriptional regulator, MarR family [Actinomycetia bacterium]|nr:transcriptional regulator, MarR family [Actinomycetes bacterium]